MTSSSTKVSDKELREREERDKTLLDATKFNGNVILGVFVVAGAAFALFAIGMRPLAEVRFAGDAPQVIALMCAVVCFMPLMRAIRKWQLGYVLQVALFTGMMTAGTWFWLVWSGAGFAQWYWGFTSQFWLVGIIAGALPLILTVVTAQRVADRRGWGKTILLAVVTIVTYAAWSGWAFS